MKKIIMIIAISVLLTSCSPVYLYDREYKVRYGYTANAKTYKYVYLLYNGSKAIYLHTDKEYSIGQTVRFNQN